MRISKAVSKGIEHLKNSHQIHLEVMVKIVEADDRRMFSQDLIVQAVLQCSFALIDGFTSMVKQRNVLCANALLRLQVDSVMRLYACWLVNDSRPLLVALLDGRPFSRLKSGDGKALTDKYLKSEVSKLYPWISRVYDKTSGFIHLSMPHMFATVASIDEGSHTMGMAIGSPQGRPWSQEEMLESVDAFTEATKSLLHLAASWLVTKEQAATSFAKADLP